MISFAWDGLSSLTIVPLRLLGGIGIAGIVFSIGMFFYSLILKLYGQTEIGWSSLISSIYLVGGLNLFGMSVLGEYIGRIFTETKHRPRYIIEKVTK